MVEVEAEEIRAIEVAEEEVAVLHTHHNNRRNPRKKTFLISPNTWTSRSLSSLTAEGKVGGIIRTYKYSLLTESLVTGTLKGYDQLMNLVLDNVKETMRGRSSK